MKESNNVYLAHTVFHTTRLLREHYFYGLMGNATSTRATLLNFLLTLASFHLMGSRVTR